MGRLTPPRPLAADDDREGFDCGRDVLNHWFRRHAWRNDHGGVSRITVTKDAATGVIAGYVSLSAAQIEREFLPKAAQRNQPSPLPAILLGQLAVDRRFQGMGCARSLMKFALVTACGVWRELGCFGVLTQPIDDEVRAFYRRFGFEELPGDPRRAMIVRMADLERSGF